MVDYGVLAERDAIRTSTLLRSTTWRYNVCSYYVVYRHHVVCTTGDSVYKKLTSDAGALTQTRNNTSYGVRTLDASCCRHILIIRV